MANSKLLKEAIADAKAVKETALANAKLALEEAFTPRLQSILSQKMRQEAEMEDDDAEKVDEELSTSGIGTGDSNGKTPGKTPTLDADTQLAPGMKKSTAKKGLEDPSRTIVDDLMEAEEGEMADGGDGGKEKEIAELRARLAELEGDEEKETEEEGMWNEEGDGMDSDEDGEDYDVTGDEEQDTEEDDMDLESIIRELEAQLGDEEDKDMETEGDDEGTGDATQASAEDTAYQTKSKNQAMDEEEEKDKEATDEVIDLEEILREMEADMADDKKEEEPKETEELKEAYKTIKSLQKTINEVNLLNAKLLFANKLFRAHNMTNEQKVKVIETLDRTKTVREVKLVYSTLAENLTKTPTKSNVAKKSITEGMASKVVKSTKPAAAAQKQVIAENADFANRFKKLAGIITN